MSYSAKNMKRIEPSDPLPQKLAHRPFFAFPYEAFDGHFAGDTDARYISVGLSQWDWYQISVKMLRHSEKKWTRQSEELPPHRVIDMTLFLIHALYLSDKDQMVIPKGTFHKQDQEITIQMEKRKSHELRSYDIVVEDPETKKLLNERLTKLAELLHKLKKEDVI